MYNELKQMQIYRPNYFLNWLAEIEDMVSIICAINYLKFNV